MDIVWRNPIKMHHSQYQSLLTLWVWINFEPVFLAHLTQRVRWAIAITWRPSSSSVVRRKLFQKSSPLKVLDQWKPNLVWIITRVSSFKIVSGDAVHQPTWPLLLNIEHMVKLQVLGNNSKTVNNIKNLTWGKSWYAAHFFNLKLTFIYYSFWNIRRKVLNFTNLMKKRAITPRWVIRFTSKLQGR
jgi:hypothetical protein